MRILLLLLALAATLCAQSPASNGSVPGWQSIVNSMLSQNSGTPAPIKPAPALAPQIHAIAPGSTLSVEAGAKPATPCSVPLLNAQIPTGVNFTMRTIEPPTDKVDHMQVIVPAPACPESPR
jgi:hypothetical protein